MLYFFVYSILYSWLNSIAVFVKVAGDRLLNFIVVFGWRLIETGGWKLEDGAVLCFNYESEERNEWCLKCRFCLIKLWVQCFVVWTRILNAECVYVNEYSYGLEF